MRTPIDPAMFHRRKFSGHPPCTSIVWGFVVRLVAVTTAGVTRQRRATPEERAWLRAHGYRFYGSRWYRADRAVQSTR